MKSKLLEELSKEKPKNTEKTDIFSKDSQKALEQGYSIEQIFETLLSILGIEERKGNLECTYEFETERKKIRKSLKVPYTLENYKLIQSLL